MAKTKSQKEKLLEELKEKINQQKIMILVDFTGLKVKDLFDLRKKLKSVNSQFKVEKKSLLNLVLKDYDTDFAQKIEQFKTQIAIVFGFEDPISPARVLYKFSLLNPNLKILSGYFEKKTRETEEIITLAQIPTREELLAKLVGSVSSPISNFINVLEANIKGLLYVLRRLEAEQR